MGLKITDAHIYENECEITVGALMALVCDGKRLIDIDGEVVRCKDAHSRYDNHTIDEWGVFGHKDNTGTFYPPKGDSSEEPALIWIHTKGEKKKCENEEASRNVEVNPKEFGDMCIYATRYNINRGTYGSIDCANFILANISKLDNRAKYVIARDIKCERETRKRLSVINNTEDSWRGEPAQVWDNLFDALGQNVTENYS